MDKSGPERATKTRATKTREYDLDKSGPERATKTQEYDYLLLKTQHQSSIHEISARGPDSDQGLAPASRTRRASRDLSL